MQKIESGIYEHYKGNKYFVIGVAGDAESEADNLVVVYVALYEPKPGKPAMQIRSLKSFIETVEVNGKRIPRFKPLF